MIYYYKILMSLNPFEEQAIAYEWMNFIENTDESLYVDEIFPAIAAWGRRQKGVLIDVGCGQGNAVHQLVDNETIQYWGIEPSPHLLDRAQELFSRYSWCTFECGSFSALPHTDNFFDAGMSINVLSHVSDINASIMELVRVLKVGASVFIVSLNPEQNDFWKERYCNAVKIDNGIMGTVVTEKSLLHRNTLYPHSPAEWERALQSNKLEIIDRKTYGQMSASSEGIFVALECLVRA